MLFIVLLSKLANKHHFFMYEDKRIAYYERWLNKIDISYCANNNYGDTQTCKFVVI